VSAVYAEEDDDDDGDIKVVSDYVPRVGGKQRSGVTMVDPLTG
jgi:hypothetical protein